MSDPIDKLAMPAVALAALAKAVPTDLVQDIARDNCPRAAPTPAALKNIVESLVKRFGAHGRLAAGAGTISPILCPRPLAAIQPYCDWKKVPVGTGGAE